MVGLDRTPRPHPLPHRRRGRRRRRRGDRRRNVPAAHQPGARPAAPHPRRDRQPGEVARRPLARPRRPHSQARPAHPVGALPRHSAIRADRTARCRLATRRRTASPRSPTSPTRCSTSSRSAPPTCNAASTRSSTGSSTRWTATPPHGNDGDSNAKPSSTADPARRKSVDAASLHDGWREQARALGIEPSHVIEDAVGQASYPRCDRSRSRSHVMQPMGDRVDHREAVDLATRRAHPRDRRVVPDRYGRRRRRPSSGGLDELTGRVAAERCVDISKPIPTARCCDATAGRSPSRSSTEPSPPRRSSPRNERLLEWADRRIDHDGPDEPAAVERSDVDLTVPQADAACAVAGHADLVLVVGPAGTGKTTALAPGRRTTPSRRPRRVRRRTIGGRRRRAVGRRPASPPTRSTSCSSSTPSTGHPTTATTSPSAPP